MDQIVLNIKDQRKRSFFLELIRQLGFIEVVREIKLNEKQLQEMKDLEEAFEDIKQHQAGKKKLKKAKDLLNEL